MSGILARRLGVLALVLMLPLRAAEGHPRVVRAVPAADSHVPTSPRDLTVMFNEPLSVALSSLTLLDAAQRPVRLDSLRAAPNDATTLTARILGTLAAGRYTVKWQAAGADGGLAAGSDHAKLRHGCTRKAQARAFLMPCINAANAGTA